MRFWRVFEFYMCQFIVINHTFCDLCVQSINICAKKKEAKSAAKNFEVHLNQAYLNLTQQPLCPITRSLEKSCEPLPVQNRHLHLLALLHPTEFKTVPLPGAPLPLLNTAIGRMPKIPMNRLSDKTFTSYPIISMSQSQVSGKKLRIFFSADSALTLDGFFRLLTKSLLTVPRATGGPLSNADPS